MGNLSESTRTFDVPAYVANGVVWGADWISVSSGNSAGTGQDGGVGAFSISNESLFEPINWDSFNNCQYLAAGSSFPVALQVGQGAKLHVYSDSRDSLTSDREVLLDPILQVDGKNTMTIQDNLLYVALGTGGMKAYDMASWSTTPVFFAPRPDIGDGLAADYLTNSVAADDDFVYLANGAGGLYVATRPSSGSELDIVGTWDFESSANFVAVSDDLIFVASGNGGLKIARKAALVSPAQAAFKTSINTRDNAKVYGDLRCNSILSEGIRLKHNSLVEGDVFCGSQGVPSAVVKKDNNVRVTGTIGRLNENLSFESRTAPDLGGSVGTVSHTGAVTFNTSFYCDNFWLNSNANATIDGDITIVVENELKMRTNTIVTLTSGSSLTIYVKNGPVKFYENVKLNQNGDVGDVNIYYLGSTQSHIYDNSIIYGTIEAPLAELKFRANAKFYGSLKADKLTLEGNAIIRIQE